MKTRTQVWQGIFVLLIAVVFLVGVSDAEAKDKIVFGQAISLSGPLAGGVAISGGKVYELWIEEVNKAGGIYVEEYGKKLPVELKRYDDKSDIGTMRNLIEKLILEDKVDFLLPPWGTAWLFAAAPIANKYGYILIGGPGGALKLKELSLPYFFQVLNFSDTQAPALADIFKEIGVKSVAVIYRRGPARNRVRECHGPVFQREGDRGQAEQELSRWDQGPVAAAQRGQGPRCGRLCGCLLSRRRYAPHRPGH